MAKKKKFSKEFRMVAGQHDIRLRFLSGIEARWFCATRFRRAFGIRKKEYPLDKPTRVRVDITILE
ncbi:MAG: hypothetical protein ACYS6W_18375 [Planctomycetota bacterium]|jgi:hypothetical protein